MIPVTRTSRYFFKKLDPVYQILEPLAYPIIRLVVGIMMIPHGYGKLFNNGGIERTAKFFSSISIEPSIFFAWYVGIIEFAGGICVAIGFLTRIFSVQLVGILFVATFVVHFQNGFLRIATWHDILPGLNDRDILQLKGIRFGFFLFVPG